MCIGIFSFRAFDRRLARLAAPISSGVRQGGQNLPPPPSGARSAEYPSGARVNGQFLKFKRHSFRLNMIYISKKNQKFVEGGH